MNEIAKTSKVLFLTLGIPLTLQGVYNVLSMFGGDTTVDTVANAVAAGMFLILACLCMMTAFLAKLVEDRD